MLKLVEHKETVILNQLNYQKNRKVLSPKNFDCAKRETMNVLHPRKSATPIANRTLSPTSMSDHSFNSWGGSPPLNLDNSKSASVLPNYMKCTKGSKARSVSRMCTPQEKTRLGKKKGNRKLKRH